MIQAEATPELLAELEAIVARPGGDSAIPVAQAVQLASRHGLASTTDLALLALPVAAAMARPAISGFRVGVIGIEVETGDLVFGGNVEFPGSDLAATVHAEGFVALRARNRSRTVGKLVVGEARPCAHCRQTLTESAAAGRLTVIDPSGNTRTLADLYPWPFEPAALDVTGDTAGTISWPDLEFVSGAPPRKIAALLLEAGRRAHAPYSGAPSAVALRMSDGRVHAAGCMESVAFNPTITALQSALVEVVAARGEFGDIRDGWLGATAEGAADPEAGFRALMRVVAPNAKAHVARWRTGQPE